MDLTGRVESVREVEIETRRDEQAPAHRTTIWAVVEDGDVYVRSLKGASGRWYRELKANPTGVLHAEGDAFPVKAVDATDPESVERASTGLRRKYADSRALQSMLEDSILDTTLKLEPR
jgi:hypothetical protein